VKRLRYEDRVLCDVALAAAPAAAVALALLWGGPLSLKAQWTLTAVVALGWVGFALSARARVVRPLQTVSNMLAGLREEDTSLRGRSPRPDDALGHVMVELNALAEALRQHKLGAAETVGLLAKVTEETEVAMFAFDADARLRIVNRAGGGLLGRPREALLGRGADELGLLALLGSDAPTTLVLEPGGGAGPPRTWQVRRTAFRQDGRTHTLVALADVSRALREEERHAWQRLVRVLSHEINNSLAPISSIASTLKRGLTDASEDTARGLDVIQRRADALARLMTAYARLARLPSPERAPVDLAALIARVATLETRAPIRVVRGPAATLHADAAQLEQLLINLVTNAVDAARESSGDGDSAPVEIAWTVAPGRVELTVRDEGPGLADDANLFVPFYTTKPGGSGIGLALSRQIAEAHGGALTLENRRDRTGCEARLTLSLPVMSRPDPGSRVPPPDRPPGAPTPFPPLAAGPDPAQDGGEP